MSIDNSAPLNRIITGSDGDILLTYGSTKWGIRNLTGRVLTIIDAALPDQRQNKATKDLIRQSFWATMRDIDQDRFILKDDLTKTQVDVSLPTSSEDFPELNF